MLFHQPDKSFKTIKACNRRAVKLAKPGAVDPLHPLATAWSNCKMMLNDTDSYIPGNPKQLWSHERRKVKAHVHNLVMLDWFAGRLDEFSKTHLLSGDSNVAAILYEWKQQLFLDPEKLQSV